MYERMLNKQEVPTFDDMLNYCGESRELWIALEKYLEDELNASNLIRFPYGKNYGWSKKYYVKSKHICDVFAENGAFTAFFRLKNVAMENIDNNLSDYTKEIWKNKYPCGDGGWIRYRVLKAEHLEDLKKLLCIKMNKKKYENAD